MCGEMKGEGGEPFIQKKEIERHKIIIWDRNKETTKYLGSFEVYPYSALLQKKQHGVSGKNSDTTGTKDTPSCHGRQECNHEMGKDWVHHTLGDLYQI